MHDVAVAAVVDDGRREQRRGRQRREPGKERIEPVARSRRAASTRRMRSASISAGDRKSMPDGSHAAGASRSAAEPARAASHARRSQAGIAPAASRIVEREREAEGAVRHAGPVATDSAGAAGSRDSARRTRRPAAPARGPARLASLAATSSCASSSSHAQPYVRSNAADSGRARYAHSASMLRGREMRDRRRRRWPPARGSEGRAAARARAVQCMCTHECQSKLP